MFCGFNREKTLNTRLCEHRAMLLQEVLQLVSAALQVT